MRENELARGGDGYVLISMLETKSAMSNDKHLTKLKCMIGKGEKESERK